MSLQQRLSAVFLVFITFSGISFAQGGALPGVQPGGTANDKSGNKPAPIMPGATVADVAKEPDYSREAMVYEQYRTMVHFENYGTGRRDTTARIRVQSEAGVHNSVENPCLVVAPGRQAGAILGSACPDLSFSSSSAIPTSGRLGGMATLWRG